MLSVNFDHRGQTLSNESRQRWQFHAILPAHTVLFKIWKLNFKRKVRVLPYYQAKLHNYSSSYPVSYLTISKPQHAENERCQQRFDAAKLPFWSLAASITAKWRTWHCVTKRFLKRNSAFHLDHVGMFCCFFFLRLETEAASFHRHFGLSIVALCLGGSHRPAYGQPGSKYPTLAWGNMR